MNNYHDSYDEMNKNVSISRNNRYDNRNDNRYRYDNRYDYWYNNYNDYNRPYDRMRYYQYPYCDRYGRCENPIWWMFWPLFFL